MAVRVKGRAAVAAIAEATGFSLDEARRHLEKARARGAVRRPDDAGRYTLTGEGRSTLAALVADAAIDRERLAALYDQFLSYDLALKRAITAWQDERSAALLGAVRTVAAPAAVLIDRLAEVDRRYDVYARRFGRMLAQIGAGDDGAVAKPGGDSLHQLWFELHEDLLVMLGRTRSS